MSSATVKVTGKGKATRPRYEIADIFREHGPLYRRSFSLPKTHRKIMRAIETCRTSELGGHLEQCDSCGHERYAYNSCRNRHCPKCQAVAKADWLEKRKAELLPVAYFHNVFTIPHELNHIALCNKKVVFDILFKTVAETLQEFAGDPKHGLGGKIGFTAILHTWDQKLHSHFHLHCVIPAGVLTFDEKNWISARKNFLFPVKALSKVFRGKFIDDLKKAFIKGKMIFPGKIANFSATEYFSRLIKQLWKKEWIVYSKAPFNGPEKVYDYLGRYTHRVAIANHRIAKIDGNHITFRYRDRNHNDKCKYMTITAQKFIYRFLLHVLPDAYMRIRHYGFLANRCKKQSLARCRELLGLCPDPPTTPDLTTQDKMLQLTGIDIAECPRCKQGQMKRIKELPPMLCISRNPFILRKPLDTS